jgi:hypothetical protein
MCFAKQRKCVHPMYYDGKVFLEEEDQCYSCKYVKESTLCPLLEALAAGVAHLNSDILVKNCGFYVEYKRHLRIIEPKLPEHRGESVKLYPQESPVKPDDSSPNNKQCGSRHLS